MCGIAGILHRDGRVPDEVVLAQLTEALAHRGPDGAGGHRRAGAAMSHTRLAIIDLETGDQPIGGERLALVANGEIYNYIELRERLGPGRFKSGSDCEPPLHLYGSSGAGFTRALRGMYAIAISDAVNNRMVLARDPFGIKPLYYAETPDGIGFASEPQALFKAGWLEPVLNPARRGELLQLQFTTGRETIFEGVNRVLPGETMVLAQGRVRYRLRQAALPIDGPADWDEGEAMRRLHAALMESVELHQRSDVAYGMFLSGGVDSAAVLSCMAELNTTPVQAFTAGFSGTDVADEREQARNVAAAVGADFHAVDFGEEDFWTLLPEIVAAFDDPVADYAILPTYRLGALAREHGLKVILSGEGGDEMFAGYGRYRRMLRPSFLGGRPMWGRGIFDGLGVLRSESQEWRAGIDAAAKRADFAGRSRLQTAQATDCADWLPHDLLLKLDRCLMAHGVEGRTPFLDPAVAGVALGLPDKLKVRKGLGKWLLRRWLQLRLPAALPFEKKRGFTVPVEEWMGRRGGDLGKLVAAQPSIGEIAEPSSVRSLFRSLEGSAGRGSGHAAWVLLYYALWHRHHIQGRTPGPNVFESLGDRA